MTGSMKMNREIILASASPRRAGILKTLDLQYRIIPADDEQQLPSMADPVATARSSAMHKAETVATITSGVVIGADTVVADGLGLLGKPRTEEEVYHYLRRLRSKEHLVITGVAVIDGNSGINYITHCKSRVWMRNYMDSEIASYIDSGSPWDKAGAYGIQDESFKPVEKVHGCYLNVVGLPVCSLLHLLNMCGIYPAMNSLWGHRGDCSRCCSLLL